MKRIGLNKKKIKLSYYCHHCYQYQNYSYINIIIIIIIYYYYQNQIMASNLFPVLVTQLTPLLCLLKEFKSMPAILHFLAPCKIMRLTKVFTESEKEFWLQQALAILKHSAMIDMQNIFEGMLLDFSGILTMLQKKLSLFSKRLISKLLFFILMSRSKNIVPKLLPFPLRNSNYPGYISLNFKHSSVIYLIQILF